VDKKQPENEADRKALAFINRYIARYGKGPSVREVGAHLGLASPNNGNAVVKRLIRDGFLPDGSAAGPGRPRVLAGLGSRSEPIEIPVIGRVGCGDGVEGLEELGEKLDLKAIFGREDLVAYQAVGDSMIEDCIAPGDYLVVRPCEAPESGETVVAVLNGGMVCKKYVLAGPTGVRLEPRNGTRGPRAVTARDALRVVGVLHGLIRKA
jgi:repressor LexA